MSTYFKPYEGRRPYLFISYSHRNSDAVLDTITLLHNRKLRLWYDEGIPAGSDWPKNIEEHMQSCSTVLFFVSKPALASANCHSEIETALRLNKPVLALPLEDVDPDESWRTLLMRCFKLAPSPDPAERAATVLGSKHVTRAYYKKPLEHFRFDILGLVLALLLFAAAAVGLYALTSGRLDRYLYGSPTPIPPTATVRVTATPSATPDPTPTPEPTPTPYVPGMDKVTFPDVTQERAVRRILGIDASEDVTLGDLAGVTELYFCGTMELASLSDVTYADGSYQVNSAKVVTGPISDLSVIRRMPYLKALALIDQPVQSLSDLDGLVLLEELSLAGCKSLNLSTLPQLLSLQTLHLEHSNATDLTVLAAQPQLKAVTVSTDMLPLVFSDDAAFDVILVP